MKTYTFFNKYNTFFKQLGKKLKIREKNKILKCKNERPTFRLTYWITIFFMSIGPYI